MAYTTLNKMVTVFINNVIVRSLSTVGYTSVSASVIHSRQWANYLNS